MLRLLIRKTAWQMDQMPKPEVEKRLSDKVSMCNYWANRLCCEAADRAMQVHGGIGYSRHKPFEHIYRHHRRYRITEGVGGDPDAQGGRASVRLHGAEARRIVRRMRLSSFSPAARRSRARSRRPHRPPPAGSRRGRSPRRPAGRRTRVSSGARKPVRMSRGGPAGRPFANGTKTTL